MLTRRPRLSSRQPIEAAARPLPKLDTTPPVTKTYFADIGATSLLNCWDWPELVDTIKYDRDRDGKEAEILPARIGSSNAVHNQLGFMALRQCASVENSLFWAANALAAPSVLSTSKSGLQQCGRSGT